MNPIEDLIKELKNLMSEQDSCLSELISEGEAQAKCLKQNDTESLQEVVRRQEVLSERLSSLEERRLQVQQQLEETLQLPGRSALRDIVIYAGSEDREKLWELRSSLREKFARLREINEMNKAMTAQALRFSDFMLRLLQPRENVYAGDGKRKKTPGAKPNINKTI